MHICLVLNAYYPYSEGGTEAYTHTLAKGLLALGNKVTVVIPRFAHKEQIPETFDYEGIQVQTYEESTPNSREALLGLTPILGIKPFVALVQNIKPDCVHFHMVTPAGINVNVDHVKAVKAAGFLTVLTMHLAHYTCLTETLLYNNTTPCDGVMRNVRCTTCYLNTHQGKKTINSSIAIVSNAVTSMLGRKPNLQTTKFLGVGMHVYNRKQRLQELVNACDQFIPITNWYKDILLKNDIHPDKLSVIKQGYIPSSDKDEIEKIAAPEKLKLVFLGRISHLKGLHIALQALQEIAPEKYSFDIFGKFNTEDSYYQKCISMVKEHGLNVTFKGTVSRELVASTLAQYSFLVLPSMFSEMSPLVIQEAFFAGIPVIGSNVHGITEQVTDGKDGLIFQFGDARSLASVFKKVLDQPELVSKLRAAVPQPRPFSSVVEETLQVYHKISS